ncbi:FtsX-like permease family protein [Streptomyces sp. NPDC048045]|uniref:FtsX-like permease family protein n=1 Tax=Streptomyces sp. NPDC048045 TaxID=3154710 RepID=UPI003432A8DE
MLALRALRARRSAFAGSFVALARGTALLTVMGLALAASLDAPERGPERFAAAPVVVRGADTVRVRTPAGEKVRELERPRPLPPAVVRQLGALGTVVVDRSFPVRADGAPTDLVGHPWSTAPFARAGLRAAVRPVHARVLTRDQWIRATHPAHDRTTRLGLLLVLGIALLYTGIGVANTMAMANADRLRDLAVLRLAGASRGQLLRLVALESLTVVAAGTLLGLLTAALHLAGLAAALHLLSAPVTVRLPWTVTGGAVAACALLAATAATVPATLALRRGAPR